MSTTLFRGGHVYSSVDPFATALVIESDDGCLGGERCGGIRSC